VSEGVEALDLLPDTEGHKEYYVETFFPEFADVYKMAVGVDAQQAEWVNRYKEGYRLNKQTGEYELKEEPKDSISSAESQHFRRDFRASKAVPILQSLMAQSDEQAAGVWRDFATVYTARNMQLDSLNNGDGLSPDSQKEQAQKLKDLMHATTMELMSHSDTFADQLYLLPADLFRR
jgi:hypothetical protein